MNLIAGKINKDDVYFIMFKNEFGALIFNNQLKMFNTLTLDTDGLIRIFDLKTYNEIDFILNIGDIAEELIRNMENEIKNDIYGNPDKIKLMNKISLELRKEFNYVGV